MRKHGQIAALAMATHGKGNDGQTSTLVLATHDRGDDKQISGAHDNSNLGKVSGVHGECNQNNNHPTTDGGCWMAVALDDNAPIKLRGQELGVPNVDNIIA